MQTLLNPGGTPLSAWRDISFGASVALDPASREAVAASTAAVGAWSWGRRKGWRLSTARSFPAPRTCGAVRGGARVRGGAGDGGERGEVIGVEALRTAQGRDFHAPLRSSEALEAARAAIRAEVPTLADDRHFARDMRRTTALVRSVALARVVGVALPGVAA